MMPMQPVAEFAGMPIPNGAAPISIELSDTSVTFGRGARAVPALERGLALCGTWHIRLWEPVFRSRA